jgi:hypothetical protein
MRASDVLVVGSRKGVFVLEAGRSGWRVASHSHAAAAVPYAFRDHRTGTLWASLDHGHWGSKIQRSSDLGRTWDEVEAPKYPKSARAKPWTTGKTQPATLSYIWTIAPGGDDEPKRLYLGTEPGGLFVSDDGGLTFELNKALWNHPTRLDKWFGGGRPLPGLHSIQVDPRDSRRVTLGVSCAGVFETTDGGRSWETRNKGLVADFLPDPNAEVGQDPHFLQGCRAAPDTMWQQNHCGIFRTANGGRTWKAVSKKGNVAHFGFAVAVDEENPDCAWVVPAVSDTDRYAADGKVCVCGTTDGGRTWRAYRKGLPQRNAYDITLRHALDRSHGALAFGTTTGNLFFSPDRGRTWETISHHLPPIYSVRFAREEGHS